MEGVTIIETSTLERLISKVESLEASVVQELNKRNKQYLTTKDVCEMLNKSENWVLLHKKELGSSKRTGSLLFKRQAIEEFIDEDYFKVKRSRS